MKRPNQLTNIICCMVFATGFWGCRQKDSIQPGPAALVPSVDTMPPRETAPGSTVDPRAVVGWDAGVDGGDGSEKVAVSGEWIQTGLYKIRLERIKGCDAPPPSAASTGAESDAGAGTARPVPAAPNEKRFDKHSRKGVGFFVQVVATRDKSFISPRDITLERGGIILESKFYQAGAAVPAERRQCSPLMHPKFVRAGENLRGFVVFEIPKSFDASNGATVLAYRPTRWGKVPRVEIPIPSCLDSCPESETASPTKAPRTRTLPRDRGGSAQK